MKTLLITICIILLSPTAYAINCAPFAIAKYLNTSPAQTIVDMRRLLKNKDEGFTIPEIQKYLKSIGYKAVKVKTAEFPVILGLPTHWLVAIGQNDFYYKVQDIQCPTPTCWIPKKKLKIKSFYKLKHEK